MSETIYAVISGELAEARKISHEDLGKIPDIIRGSFKEVNRHRERVQRMDYEIIRMDEFLCITDRPVSSLHSMIMLASDFRLKTYRELNIRADLRLSIGVGPVELMQRELRESDGTAFRYAADGLKSFKRNQRLFITTPDKEINKEFAVACGFMDILIHDWSDEQAEALFLSLSGKNQTEISEELKISQPAVNRRLKAAHADAIERFIKRYEHLLAKL